MKMSAHNRAFQKSMGRLISAMSSLNLKATVRTHQCLTQGFSQLRYSQGGASICENAVHEAVNVVLKLESRWPVGGGNDGLRSVDA